MWAKGAGLGWEGIGYQKYNKRTSKALYSGGLVGIRNITMSSLARKLKISVPAVSKSTIRGKKLAKDRKYMLVE